MGKLLKNIMATGIVGGAVLIGVIDAGKSFLNNSEEYNHTISNSVEIYTRFEDTPWDIYKRPGLIKDDVSWGKFCYDIPMVNGVPNCSELSKFMDKERRIYINIPVTDIKSSYLKENNL